jgi:hypothetical protein
MEDRFDLRLQPLRYHRLSDSVRNRRHTKDSRPTVMRFRDLTAGIVISRTMSYGCWIRHCGEIHLSATIMGPSRWNAADILAKTCCSTCGYSAGVG